MNLILFFISKSGKAKIINEKNFCPSWAPWKKDIIKLLIKKYFLLIVKLIFFITKNTKYPIIKPNIKDKHCSFNTLVIFNKNSLLLEFITSPTPQIEPNSEWLSLVANPKYQDIVVNIRTDIIEMLTKTKFWLEFVFKFTNLDIEFTTLEKNKQNIKQPKKLKKPFKSVINLKLFLSKIYKLDTLLTASVKPFKNVKQNTKSIKI